MGRTSNAKERMLEAARDLIWRHSYCSVTVDAICAAASVRKGSFYHFFDCKAELAEAAFTSLWESAKPQLDAIFSAGVPPLDRLRNYFSFLYEKQAELKQKYGHVVGCPFGSLGSELSQREEAICVHARAVLLCYRKYFETALSDAQAEGSICIKDIPAAAQRLSAYIEGCVLQARVQNDLSPLRELMPGALMVMGVPPNPASNARRSEPPRSLRASAPSSRRRSGGPALLSGTTVKAVSSSG